MDQLGDAGDAMGDAEGQLGDGDAEGAVGSQGRALEAMRKGAQGMAQAMQQAGADGTRAERPPGPRPISARRTTPIRSAGRCAAAIMATTSR